MTTTLRARFDGKVLVPMGEVDLPIGQEVQLQISSPENPPLGSPLAILQTVRSLPTLPKEDIDELEQCIEQGKLPPNGQGIFDED